MFAKATKCRFFSVFAVVMLMLCSVAVIADADASPYGGVGDNTGSSKEQVYAIQISTGQTFTYSNIATNLDGYGTINYSWTGAAADENGTDGIKWDNSSKTLSGVFQTTGDKQGVLTATWIAPGGSDNNVSTQTAKQTLNFEVIEALDITKTKTAGYGMVDGTAANQVVLTIPYTGVTTNTAPAVEYTAGDSSKSPFTFSLATNADKKIIQVTSSEALNATGSWTVKLTLSNTNTGDEDSVTITLDVYDKIAITNDNKIYYTYEGDSNLKTFKFEIDKDDEVTEVSKNIDFSNGSITVGDKTYNVLSQNDDGYTVSIDTSFGNESGTLTGGSVSKDYSATMSITGKVTSDSGEESQATTTGTFNLKVYRSLEFTSSPVIKDAKAVGKSTGTNNLMTLSANVSGAKYVTINWGDGTTSNKTAVGTSSIYNAPHKYANAGMYMITITAENDVGTTTSKVLYAVDSALDVTPDTTDDDKKTGFFEEHGYLFLVFILILVGLLVAYFYFGIQHPFVLLLAIVCAVLAVALFVYGDFSGIADALKGSK